MNIPCDICGRKAKKLYHCGPDFDMDCYKASRCKKCADAFQVEMAMALSGLTHLVQK